MIPSRVIHVATAAIVVLLLSVATAWGACQSYPTTPVTVSCDFSEAVESPVNARGDVHDVSQARAAASKHAHDTKLAIFDRLDPVERGIGQSFSGSYNYAEGVPSYYTDPMGTCPFCPLLLAPVVPEIVVGGSAFAAALGITVGCVISCGNDRYCGGRPSDAQAVACRQAREGTCTGKRGVQVDCSVGPTDGNNPLPPLPPYDASQDEVTKVPPVPEAPDVVGGDGGWELAGSKCYRQRKDGLMEIIDAIPHEVVRYVGNQEINTIEYSCPK